MSSGHANSAYAGTFVEELARSGLRHVCVSPGSRSTPLALALAAHPLIRVWMHLDERSSAFFALGMAKASRQPVAVLCTSGTAAANFFPAVLEAEYGRTPLILLTADRPPELRDCGAPQAIDQIQLYGGHVKWHADMAAPEESGQMLGYARIAACRAYALAAASPAGPVHLNFPFREPLLPEPDGASARDQTSDLVGGRFGPAATTPATPTTGPNLPGERAGERPFVEVTQGRRQPDVSLVERLARELETHRRGLVVCGPQEDPALPDAAARLARRLGYPVLADPLSGLRCGPHDRSLVIDAYDAFLRDSDRVAAHAPDVVIRLGAMPTSKPLLQYLQRYPACRQTVVDGGDGWREPALLAADMVWADPVLCCEALIEEVREVADPLQAWAGGWCETNARTRRALDERLAGTEELFEGRVFSELAELLPDGAMLYVGNSMPVRDLDTFFGSTGRALRILGNRGVSGIDGVVSSALGASAVSEGPTVLVIGDLSFYHDMNGLLAARLHALNATVVLINNDGGGIFSFLPQAAYPEHFEELFGTPHGLDFSPAVGMYGGRHLLVDTWKGFREAVQTGMALGGLTVVEVRTERAQNVALHREMTAAVSRALAGWRMGGMVPDSNRLQARERDQLPEVPERLSLLGRDQASHRSRAEAASVSRSVTKPSGQSAVGAG